MRYTMDGEKTPGFWHARMQMAIDQMIPYQLAVLEDRNPEVKSCAIENFRIAAGLSGAEYYGMIFQDSDVGKWIEAAANSLLLRPDAALEEKLDEIIDIIALAQQEDGYLNTYFTVKAPELRWENLLECHEMYCAGHLIEGAVAYYLATGKEKFLNVMRRMADHIDSLFGPDDGKRRGYPGHPELELALMRLYGVTGDKKYADLAAFMVNERGQSPSYYQSEIEARGGKSHYGGMYKAAAEYAQWHAPVREQSSAVGHAVRALYLYAGMADVAAHTGDTSLLNACRRLWESAGCRQRYITGAYGAQRDYESFSIDYELPNDSVYAETCASIAMIFFSDRMLRIERDGKYADIVENALFNTVLAGTQLDGTRFFYCNPLEAVRGASGILPEYAEALPERPSWYACACCPPNLARLLTSLSAYAYEEREGEISIHQFLGGTCAFDLVGATIKTSTLYPWNGALAFDVSPNKDGARFALRLRVPGWCERFELTIDGEGINAAPERGYITIEREWRANTRVLLTLDMPARRTYASTRVRENAGCVAIERGPVVYCFESVDNGGALHNLRIPRSAKIEICEYDPALLSGVAALTLTGARVESEDDLLYSPHPPAQHEAKLTAIPYFAWANRGPSDMRVWLPES